MNFWGDFERGKGRGRSREKKDWGRGDEEGDWEMRLYERS
jgi:hypothetical protein